jgi:hypothetical protein
MGEAQRLNGRSLMLKPGMIGRKRPWREAVRGTNLKLPLFNSQFSIPVAERVAALARGAWATTQIENWQLKI